MSIHVATIADVRIAEEVIRQHVSPAPLVRSYPLERELGLARHRVWLKDYGWTPVGSFKLLGALNWMANNLEQIGDKPVAAHSSGNFASGIAFAGMRYGKRLIIVMPETAPRVKFERTRSFGAEIRTYDIATDHLTGQRDKLTHEIAEKEEAVQAFPYDPKKAAALLDAAGWAVNPSTKVREKNGKVLGIVANVAAGDAFNLGESASSEAVAQYLGDVGVKVTLEASERGEYFPRLVKGQNRQHLSHGGWLSVPVLDADFVYSNFSCKERSDRYPVCDPANATYEDLYGRQKHELDEKKRAAYLNELAEWVHERAIAIYLVQPHEVWALGSKVKGFVVRPDRIIRWDSVSSGS